MSAMIPSRTHMFHTMQAEKSKAELEKTKHESEETFQSMQNRLDQQEHENFVLRENAVHVLCAIRSHA